MSKIEFRDVSKRYGSQAPTIQSATLTIEHGELCVFVGPSGCGKSTLLRMVAGLESITSGDIAIEGERVNDLAPARRGVAMVFQSYALYPHMSVRENMAFALKVFGVDRASIDKKVRETAQILQLTPLLDRLPKQLSGGQRQRVAIGRAIVKEPRVFLFDEPLSNLDAALRVQTRLEIAKLHERLSGASMIYVTHDQVEAMTLADKIVLLRAGEDVASKGSIAQIGAPLDLYHRPASRFVAEFIGSPKMNLMPAALEEANGSLAKISVAGVSLQARVNASGVSPGAQVKLGVRPEHLAVVDGSGGANRIGATVSHVERLGESSLLYVNAEGVPGLITVRVEGAAAQRAGDRIMLYAPPESVHVFGADDRSFTRTLDLPH
ncbi:MAG TPA: sn-glycerol-3-phosphate ABC transporter ATP-binding protein UgpC [Burkholderiaceae bacterium]